jgi:hypothetical protein
MIASKVVQPGTSFANQNLTLTVDEVNQIVDWSKLNVQVSAGIQLITSCSDVNPAPQNWKVTLSGFGLGTCADCGIFNDTHTLTYDGSGCSWRKSFGRLCGDPPGVPDSVLSLSYNSGSPGYWELMLSYFSVVNQVTWKSSGTANDGLSSHVLAFNSFAGDRCRYDSRASVVIYPA